MRNNRGITIRDRLYLNIELAESAKNKDNKKALAFQALGAVEIAVEFGLITTAEWEKYINDIFTIL